MERMAKKKKGESRKYVDYERKADGDANFSRHLSLPSKLAVSSFVRPRAIRHKNHEIPEKGWQALAEEKLEHVCVSINKKDFFPSFSSPTVLVDLKNTFLTLRRTTQVR